MAMLIVDVPNTRARTRGGVPRPPPRPRIQLPTPALDAAHHHAISPRLQPHRGRREHASISMNSPTPTPCSPLTIIIKDVSWWRYSPALLVSYNTLAVDAHRASLYVAQT